MQARHISTNLSLNPARTRLATLIDTAYYEILPADPINEMPGRRCCAVEGALRQLVNLFEDFSFLDVSKTCYLERRTRSKNYNRCISGA